MFKDLKVPTTYSQQVSILKSRNIHIHDADECERFLALVNYYRFTGYLLPFIRKPDELCCFPVSFERIRSIYEFDTSLRNLLFGIIETIETYLRTQLSYYSAHHFGADGYMDANNYNVKHDHAKFIGIPVPVFC